MGGCYLVVDSRTAQHSSACNGCGTRSSAVTSTAAAAAADCTGDHAPVLVLHASVAESIAMGPSRLHHGSKNAYPDAVILQLIVYLHDLNGYRQSC